MKSLVKISISISPFHLKKVLRKHQKPTSATCERIPTPFAVIGNVIDKSKIFFNSPRTSSKVGHVFSITWSCGPTTTTTSTTTDIHHQKIKSFELIERNQSFDWKVGSERKKMIWSGEREVDPFYRYTVVICELWTGIIKVACDHVCVWAANDNNKLLLKIKLCPLAPFFFFLRKM